MRAPPYKIGSMLILAGSCVPDDRRALRREAIAAAAQSHRDCAAEPMRLRRKGNGGTWRDVFP